MKRVGSRAAVLAIVVALVVLASASTALAFGGASGDVSYTCPFTGGGVQAQFWAQQTSAAYDGYGQEVISYGGCDNVRVTYVRVVTPRAGVREAYLAGPVVRSTVPGMSSFWWYMAMRDAPGTANDKIVGHYLRHNQALDAVVNGAWTDRLTDLTSTDFVIWR
jgi:hypothetical protein